MSKPVKVIGGCILAVLCLWILLTSRTPSGGASLVGAYTASYANDKYFLELREDGTYTQKIVRTDGNELTDSGHWESDYSKYFRNSARVKFTNFKFFETGQLITPGLCDVYVNITAFAGVELVFTDDLGFSYSSPLPEKKDPNE